MKTTVLFDFQSLLLYKTENHWRDHDYDCIYQQIFWTYANVSLGTSESVKYRMMIMIWFEDHSLQYIDA